MPLSRYVIFVIGYRYCYHRRSEHSIAGGLNIHCYLLLSTFQLWLFNFQRMMCVSTYVGIHFEGLYCKSESLSVEGLHEIIEQHGWTPDNTHHLKIDYGFFFAACENERFTEEIIQCLLTYFPHVTGATDDVGQGPLHCACSNKSLASGKIIQLLIDAAPNSVAVKIMMATCLSITYAVTKIWTKHLQFKS